MNQHIDFCSSLSQCWRLDTMLISQITTLNKMHKPFTRTLKTSVENKVYSCHVRE